MLEYLQGFFAKKSGQKLGGHHADIDVPWIKQGCEYDHGGTWENIGKPIGKWRFTLW